MQHQLVVSNSVHSEGTLPKKLRNPMKGLINIQNEDNECFRWCLVRYLNPVKELRTKKSNERID